MGLTQGGINLEKRTRGGANEEERDRRMKEASYIRGLPHQSRGERYLK